MAHSGQMDIKLWAAFKAFCSFGDRGNEGLMTGAQFSKLARDCGIQGRRVTATEVDITFTRVRHGARRIHYSQFVTALEHLAMLRFPGKAPESAYLEARELVLNAHGPHTTNTTDPHTPGAFGRVTDESKHASPTHAHETAAAALQQGHAFGLSDSRDAAKAATPKAEAEARRLFTKYDANGNERMTESELRTMLEGLRLHVDDVHAEYQAACAGHNDLDFPHFLVLYTMLVARKEEHARLARARERGRRASTDSSHSHGSKHEEHTEAVPHEDGLEAAFVKFCTYGGARERGAARHHMDGAHWVKFCKDAKLVARRRFTTTDADLAFAAVKTRGERRINFRQFEAALGLVAKKLYPKATPAHALATVVDTILGSRGPKSHCTKVVNSGITRKLTNPSLYTGSSRARFDAEGHGVGTGSRRSSVGDLADITRPNLRHSPESRMPVGMH